jgi:hypothetical protein
VIMSPRGNSSRHRSSPGQAPRSHSPGPAGTATRRWRRDNRRKVVRSAISATRDLRWNRHLFEAILEELYVDDQFEEFLGQRISNLRPRDYAQAIAAALILRHSWHPDDLAYMAKRLRLRVHDE